MRHIRPLPLVIAVTLIAVLGCDKDPAQPVNNFSVAGCPVGPLSVNAPINLSFAGGSPQDATISGANIVVSNATTGVELPGSLSANTSGGITFSPSTPLPFDTPIRIRVQNLRAKTTNAPLSLFVCEVRTVLPEITQLYWRRLPDATGRGLLGATLISKDSGYVISQTGVLFRRQGGDFGVAFSSPYVVTGQDVDFVTQQHGFASIVESRIPRSNIVETLDGALTFDTIFTIANRNATRIVFRNMPGLGTNAVWGVVGSGSSSTAQFWKWRPQTRTASQVASYTTVGGVGDISFGSDTTFGAAVGGGFKLGVVQPRGRVWVTTDGGNTWPELTNLIANNTSVEYFGVAKRNDGVIWVTGGSGYVLKLTGSGTTYTFQRVVFPITNPDSTNPDALIMSDIEFAPDNQSKGWLVGAELRSLPGQEPRYQGFIFETIDGGVTWTRQGVRGAAKNGADMPRLRRIEVLNQNNVWIVGDAGAVLSYQP